MTGFEGTKKRPRGLDRFLDKGQLGLVTATAIAAAATVSAATTTAITTVSAAATTTTTAAATVSATTAAFALFHGTRFVDGEGAAVDFLAMELGNGRLGFFGGAHFDKAETAGTAGDAVVDHLHPGDIARLSKEIGQVVFRHAKGQVAHIEFYAHYFLLGWLADVSGIGSTLPLSSNSPSTERQLTVSRMVGQAGEGARKFGTG
jgi:hypothetical protein